MGKEATSTSLRMQRLATSETQFEYFIEQYAVVHGQSIEEARIELDVLTKRAADKMFADQNRCAQNLSYATDFLSGLDFQDRYKARWDEFVSYMLRDYKIREWLTKNRKADDHSINLSKLLVLGKKISYGLCKESNDSALSRRLNLPNAETARRNISHYEESFKAISNEFFYYIRCMTEGKDFLTIYEKEKW